MITPKQKEMMLVWGVVQKNLLTCHYPHIEKKQEQVGEQRYPNDYLKGWRFLGGI
jgi:hypothetical protein